MTKKLKAIIALLKSEGYVLITKKGNLTKYETTLPPKITQHSCSVLYNAVEAAQGEGMVRQAKEIINK